MGVFKHFKFSKQEIRDIAIVILVLGFILSFKHWGYESFDAKTGFTNLILMIIAVAISLFLRISLQKMIAVKKGATVEYKMWLLGLFIALYVAFISNGDWYFMIPGGIAIASLTAHRISRKSQELEFKEIRFISLAGPMASLILALIFKAIYLSGTTNLFISKMATLNFVLAICTMLPIPELERLLARKQSTHWVEGLAIFYSGRIKYLFWLLFVIIISALQLYTGIIASVILSIIIAAMIAALVWFVREA